MSGINLLYKWQKKSIWQLTLLDQLEEIAGHFGDFIEKSRKRKIGCHNELLLAFLISNLLLHPPLVA